jgi:hypothetical protein
VRTPRRRWPSGGLWPTERPTGHTFRTRRKKLDGIPRRVLEKTLLDSISLLPLSIVGWVREMLQSREHLWLRGFSLEKRGRQQQKDFPLFKTLECGEKNISVMSKDSFFLFTSVFFASKYKEHFVIMNQLTFFFYTNFFWLNFFLSYFLPPCQQV